MRGMQSCPRDAGRPRRLQDVQWKLASRRFASVKRQHLALLARICWVDIFDGKESASAAIGELVRIATSGGYDAQVARLNLDARQICVRVRLADAARHDLDKLANLRVRGRDGPVPLSSVAKFSIESGPSQIDRYDRYRYVTVDADLGGTPLGAALNAALDLPAARGLPSSVKLIQSGDAETAAELASGFGIAVIVGVLCLFCVLALLFRDFLQPITILSALPLSFGGAFVAL